MPDHQVLDIANTLASVLAEHGVPGHSWHA
jgi:hypothetical protein